MKERNGDNNRQAVRVAKHGKEQLNGTAFVSIRRIKSLTLGTNTKHQRSNAKKNEKHRNEKKTMLLLVQ